MTRSVILLSVVLGLAACSGNTTGVGNGNAGPAADLSGSWQGKWTSSTGAGGTVQLTAQQTGGAADGDVHFTGSPCFSSGHFTGTVSGRDFTGSVTAGAIRVVMNGTITGNSYDGTYDAAQAGACSGDTGTFTATR